LPSATLIVEEMDEPVQYPDELPLVTRRAVRIVILDNAGRVLLLHTHDRDHPQLGDWWELPGGGIDDGETYREAAVRELSEETGLVVDASNIGAPTWRRRASFRHRQTRHVQDEIIVTTCIPLSAPSIDASRRLDYELDDYFDFRWWSRREIANSTERFYPGRLPTLLDAFLAGEEIDEPFELWS
jgi:8-oxo-dGTP pyrophosphatase MutT (NUDIX family)